MQQYRVGSVPNLKYCQRFPTHRLPLLERSYAVRPQEVAGLLNPQQRHKQSVMLTSLNHVTSYCVPANTGSITYPPPSASIFRFIVPSSSGWKWRPTRYDPSVRYDAYSQSFSLMRFAVSTSTQMLGRRATNLLHFTVHSSRHQHQYQAGNALY